MVAFIKSRASERHYETYRLFPKIDDSILGDLSASDVSWSEITENIYIAKMSGKTNELLKIFHRHNLYAPFKFEYKKFLALAIFFIDHDFEIFDLSFHDSSCEINPHHRLEQFDVKKSVRRREEIWMTFLDDGTIDSNVDPTNYLRSFYLL